MRARKPRPRRKRRPEAASLARRAPTAATILPRVLVPATARAGPKMLLEGLCDEGPEEPTLLEASQPNASPEVLGHASVQVHQGLGTRVAGGRGVAARCHGRSSQFPVARAFLRGYPPFLRCRAIVPGRVECPRGRVGRRIAVEAYVPPCAFGRPRRKSRPESRLCVRISKRTAQQTVIRNQ